MNEIPIKQVNTLWPWPFKTLMNAWLYAFNWPIRIDQLKIELMYIQKKNEDAFIKKSLVCSLDESSSDFNIVQSKPIVDL